MDNSISGIPQQSVQLPKSIDEAIKITDATASKTSQVFKQTISPIAARETQPIDSSRIKQSQTAEQIPDFIRNRLEAVGAAIKKVSQVTGTPLKMTPLGGSQNPVARVTGDFMIPLSVLQKTSMAKHPSTKAARIAIKNLITKLNEKAPHAIRTSYEQKLAQKQEEIDATTDPARKEQLEEERDQLSQEMGEVWFLVSNQIPDDSALKGLATKLRKDMAKAESAEEAIEITEKALQKLKTEDNGLFIDTAIELLQEEKQTHVNLEGITTFYETTEMVAVLRTILLEFRDDPNLSKFLSNLKQATKSPNAKMPEQNWLQESVDTILRAAGINKGSPLPQHLPLTQENGLPFLFSEITKALGPRAEKLQESLTSFFSSKEILDRSNTTDANKFVKKIISSMYGEQSTFAFKMGLENHREILAGKLNRIIKFNPFLLHKEEITLSGVHFEGEHFEYSNPTGIASPWLEDAQDINYPNWKTYQETRRQSKRQM